MVKYSLLSQIHHIRFISHSIDQSNIRSYIIAYHHLYLSYHFKRVVEFVKPRKGQDGEKAMIRTLEMTLSTKVKQPARKVWSRKGRYVYIVPLIPTYKAGLAGYSPGQEFLFSIET
jgi:hypothetical protein